MIEKIFSQYERMYTKAFLIFLLTAAAVLRIASCGKYIFMDESLILSNIINFLRNHTLIPINFLYPSLFSYLSTIPTALGAIILYIRGTLQSFMHIEVLFFFYDSVIPILPARFTSVVFGLATILLVFKIGEKFFDKKIGLIAAAFLSFSKLHIDYSSYALPDVTMTYFATCSLFFSLSALKTKSIRDFILAGAFAGFTASAKYNGVLIILPIMSVHFIHLYDEKSYLSLHGWFNKRILFSIFTFTCSFLIASPGWLFSLSSFLNAFAYQQRVHMATGHLGHFGVFYIQHLILFWRWEKTTVILIGVGILYSIFRHTKQDVVLLSIILPSFFCIGSWQKKNLHYLLFLYPALVLLSSRFLSEILPRLKKRMININIFLIITLAFIWPIYSSTLYAYTQIQEDCRWVAYRWIQDNISEGSKIIIDWAYLPKLITKAQKGEMLNGKHKEFYVTYFGNIHTYELIPLEYSPFWLAKVQADYLITSSYCFDPFFKTQPPPPDNPLLDDYYRIKNTYNALFFREKEMGWKLFKEFYTGKGPRVLIYIRNKEESRI